jgi:MFS family permease
MQHSGDRRVRSKIVALMVALSAMSYINRTLMPVAAPTLIKHFHLSETQMGSIFSAFILSYAILMAPGGWLADRFGPRLRYCRLYSSHGGRRSGQSRALRGCLLVFSGCSFSPGRVLGSPLSLLRAHERQLGSYN